MNNIGKEFLEQTKYTKMKGKSDQEKGVKAPIIDMPFDQEAEMIDLPDHSEVESNSNLHDLITNRRSVREYSKESLTLHELSYLLWTTQGVKEILEPMPEYKVTLRTVPSAGARHPFETFLLINNVEGVKPGIYRYLASKHKLIEFNVTEGMNKKVSKACLGQRFIEKSAVTFIWVADIYKTIWRYKERSYRYALLDAGHVCQNLYLSASTINSGVCAIAAYDDDEMNRILELDGEDQFTIYLATLGKVRK